jgi:hypothetical protein
VFIKRHSNKIRLKKLKKGKTSCSCKAVLLENMNIFSFYPLMPIIIKAIILAGFPVILVGCLEKRSNLKMEIFQAGLLIAS